MRNCVILGCGRSGTSLLGGVLASAGYDLGGKLLRPNESNPKGFFEDADVNAINAELLEPAAAGVGVGTVYDRELRRGERWLAALPTEAVVPPPTPPLRARMSAAIEATDAGRPVCRKDPRFSYTLPAWTSTEGPDPVRSAVRVVVFRDPARTAHSIADHASSGTLGLTPPRALAVWTAVYRYVLERLLPADHADAPRPQWYFVHYDTVLDGSALGPLGDLLGTPLSASFGDPALRRSSGNGLRVPTETAELYAELCDRARGVAGG